MIAIVSAILIFGEGPTKNSSKDYQNFQAKSDPLVMRTGPHQLWILKKDAGILFSYYSVLKLSKNRIFFCAFLGAVVISIGRPAATKETRV